MSRVSVALPTSQLIFQSFYHFFYVTGSSLTSPGKLVLPEWQSPDYIEMKLFNYRTTLAWQIMFTACIHTHLVPRFARTFCEPGNGCTTEMSGKGSRWRDNLRRLLCNYRDNWISHCAPSTCILLCSCYHVTRKLLVNCYLSLSLSVKRVVNIY